MRKTLRFIAKFIAVIFATLFVITALLTLPLVNAGWSLFGPNLYKRALAEQNIYGRLPTLASEQVIHSLTYNPCEKDPHCLEGEQGRQDGGEVGELLDPGITPFFLLNLTKEDLEGIIAGLAPPHWVQEQTESVIDQLFAYLNFGHEPALTVSLVEFKERLAGEEGIHAFMRMALAQPPCTPEQVEIIASDEDVKPEEMPICRPPKALEEKYTQKAEKTLQAATADILDDVSLITLLEKEGVYVSLPKEPGSLEDDPRIGFQIAKWSMRLSFLVPIAMLVLVTLAGVRSWKAWARWWSILFLVVGVADLVLALVALPANWAFGAYIAGQAPPELTRNLVNAGLDAERYIVRSLAMWIAIESGVLTLLGLVLLGVSSRLKGEIEDI